MESEHQAIAEVFGKVLPDRYTLRARVWPVLLVALPGIAAAFALFPGIEAWGNRLWALLAAGGLPALIAQLGRDRGRAKEPALWQSWGGTPTTQRLRHRGPTNRHVLAGLHAKMAELMPTVHVPSREDEERDPGDADEAYAAFATLLRTRTRDTKRFRLVFEENCNYGFRRNLWGMKPIGLAVSIVTTFVVGTSILLCFRNGLEVEPLMWGGEMVSAVAVCLWLAWVNPHWVRTAAEAYAERLLEAAVMIPATPQEPQ